MGKEEISLQLKQIRPTQMDPGQGFLYDVDYEIELMPTFPTNTSASITGTLTVKVDFRHGNQQRNATIEDIEGKSKRAIRERFSELVDHLKGSS